MNFMRLNYVVILLFITHFCLLGQKPNDVTGKFYIPPMEKVGEGALLKREFIYPLDQRPEASAHASTIVETPSGMVAAFFAGPHENHPDVGIRVSHLKDGKWTWPVEVANGFHNDTLRYATWNPVLFQPTEGPLYLFYKEGPNPRDWWGMMKYSTDDGYTWSYGEKIGEDEKVGHLLGPVKNKSFQLPDGSILHPSSSERIEGDETFWKIHFEKSDAKMKNWEVIGPIHDGVTFDAIQPSIMQLADGRLMVLARTRQGVLAQSWSSDNGKTWSDVKSINLPNPNSGTDAVTLQDGRQLLIYNHKVRTKENRGRDLLNLAISDDGIKWTPVMTIENEESEHGYAYPAIIQSKDGLVHATYTFNRESVKYLVIDPKKLVD
ncbi:MAG: sialidase [Pseudozobellia sp.]|nr:sialidase [Pseudozobellia sp.]|tara:strand:- start:943 stop:2076 length:1134 start_codon:yes stop_codon:yes gene_type:complete